MEGIDSHVFQSLQEEFMSSRLKVTFILFMIITLLFGVPLMLAPGHFLGFFHWAPIDPLISRLLGATLISLGWGSYIGWHKTDFKDVTLLIQINSIFTVGGVLGFLRHLLKGWWPPMVWGIFFLLLFFACLWLFALWKKD